MLVSCTVDVTLRTCFCIKNMSHFSCMVIAQLTRALTSHHRLCSPSKEMQFYCIFKCKILCLLRSCNGFVVQNVLVSLNSKAGSVKARFDNN